MGMVVTIPVPTFCAAFMRIAFSHRQHYDKLEKCMEREPKSIRLAGRRPVPGWTQIFADVMKCPVETVAVRETGALKPP